MQLIAGLPGLHGLLIASLGIIHYRRTKRGKNFLTVELICSSLLIISWLLIIIHLWLEWRWLGSSICGWWLAVIATLVLAITAIIKVLRNKRNWALSLVGVLLNLLALIIYLVLALWFSWILLIMLLGGPSR
jgi:hypothetical protein